MAAPTLAELVTASSAADILQIELTIAQQQGLPITSWQPLDPSRTILQINANIAATYSSTVSFLAQGAYASLAATMVDANGNPVTTWMDLRGVDQYNVTRVPATAATGTVPLTNTSVTAYPYTPQQPLHFQNAATGATYTTVGSGTVAASGPSMPVIQADAAWVGNAGTIGTGVVLTLVTPLAGVTVGALTTSLVGADAESNAHYLARCQAKLGSISPNGSPSAYSFVAESLPVFGTTLPDGTLFLAPSKTQPWGITTPITRVSSFLMIGSGILQVYVADAAGIPNGSAHNPITNVTWSAGTATVTCSLAHGFTTSETGFAIIAGVLGALGVNNQIAGSPAWPITAINSTQFTFPLANNPGAYTSGGYADVGDLGMVNNAIQAKCVPQGQTALVQAPSSVAVPVTATVYIPSTSGISPSVAQTNISNALAAYFATIPIGGLTAESSNIVPVSGIQGTIRDANPGTVSVVQSAPSVDVPLTSGQIATLGTLTITVVYV